MAVDTDRRVPFHEFLGTDSEQSFGFLASSTINVAVPIDTVLGRGRCYVVIQGAEPWYGTAG